MEQLTRAAEAGIVNLQSKHAETAPIESDGAPESLNGDPEQDATVVSEAADSVTAAVAGNDDAAAAAEQKTTDVSARTDNAGSDRPVVDASDVTALANRLKNKPVDADTPVSEGSVSQEQQQVAQANDQALATETGRCFSREQLALPDVLPGQQLAALIGAQRKELVGEFDRANTAPAIELAKTYLSVGMVEEARTVIDEFAESDPLGIFFSQIADVWTGKDVEASGSLFMDDCIGVQALWRAFAQSRLGWSETALRSEVSSGSSLEELPLHPRQTVAAELGLTAAKQGQWDSARRLSAMAIRAADGEQQTLGSTHLLSYRLAKWRDDSEEASEHLARAATTDPDTATEALLIRAEDALQSDDVLNPDHRALRMDLGALARQELGSALAQRAFELEARLFHREAGSDETISFLSDAVNLGLLPPERHATFLSELISKPAFSDVSRPLAHIYLDAPKKFEGAIEQPVLRRSLIRSLALEGVPGIAAGLVEKGDLEDADLAAELARSFVEAGEYRDAIAILSRSEDGVRQRLILSEAFLAMGDFEKAISILASRPNSIPTTAEEEKQIAAAQLAAEIAGKDFSAALETALAQLTAGDDRRLAEQSALIALETGAPEIPDAARTILASEAGGSPTQLEDMFSLNGSRLLEGDQNLETLIKQLEVIEASEGLIQEILENG